MAHANSSNNKSLDNFTIPNTDNTGNVGIYKIGTTNFLSNFGNNIFVGGAGNLTLSNLGVVNIGIGPGTLASLNNGDTNICIGNGAAPLLTDGTGNIFLGDPVANILTSGNINIAIGQSALGSLLTGNGNIAIGPAAGGTYASNESNNICIGIYVSGELGESNVTRIGDALTTNCYIGGCYANPGTGNTFVGSNSNTIPIVVGFSFDNVGVGDQALSGLGNNSSQNVAIGKFALGQITDNTFNNTCLGYNAGSMYVGGEASNICIGSNGSEIAGENSVIRIGDGMQMYQCYITNVYSNYGSSNVFVGSLCGNFSLTSANCVGVGQACLESLTNGGENCALGEGSLPLLQDGGGNSAFGFSTLSGLVSGSFNTAIGYGAGSGYLNGNETNNICIGNNVIGFSSESNVIRIGDTASITSCFIAGITGINPATGSLIVVDSSSTLGTVVDGLQNNLIQFNVGATPTYTATPSVDSITILNSPVNPTDGVNLAYTSALASGIQIKLGCYAGTIGTNLTSTYSNGTLGVGATLTNSSTQAAFALDGTSPPINSRILVKDQTAPAQNGIYTLTTVGTGATNWVLTRATDFDQQSPEINPGDLVPISNGTVNAVTSWVETSTIATVGTDPITFSPFSFGPSTFLVKANNLSDVLSTSTARSNLGLTNISTQAVTQFDVLVGGAANSITSIGPGTAGQILRSGGAAANPAYSVATYPSASGVVGNVLTSDGTNWLSSTPGAGGTVTSVTGTANQVDVATGTTTPVISLIGPYTPDTYASQGILYGNNSSSIQATSTVNNAVLVTSNSGVPSLLPNSGTAGFVLTANSGAAPSWQANISGGLKYVAMTGSTTLVAGVGYIDTNPAGTTLTFTVPASAAVGDTFGVVNAGLNASGRFVIQAAGGQIINYISASTSVGGTATANERFTNVTLLCTVANTEFLIVDVEGTVTLA